jgi:hypothetical protein
VKIKNNLMGPFIEKGGGGVSSPIKKILYVGPPKHKCDVWQASLGWIGGVMIAKENLIKEIYANKKKKALPWL